MTRRLSNRVQKQLETFAPYLGSGLKDAKGKIIDFGANTEAMQRQHLFWVKHEDMEGVTGHFFTGDRILGKIFEDCYEIEYLGTDKNRPMELQKKYEDLKAQQAREIDAARSKKEQRVSGLGNGPQNNSGKA